MKKLSNRQLTICVSTLGAELQSIVKNDTNKEYLWQGDPAYWERRSPILFPIVGSVWEGKFRHQGTTYSLGHHGFAKDMSFATLVENDSELRFAIESTPQTLEVYPFPFRLEIGYRLLENKLQVLWTVVNTGTKEMHFQIGAHPAFYLPNYDKRTTQRGYFAFDKQQGLLNRQLAELGCVAPTSEPLPVDAEGLLPIDTHTFDIDTYVLEKSQVNRVDLLDLEKNPYLTMRFSSPVVCLWSPATEDAPFVCIEPWYGRCDPARYAGEFKDREYMYHLLPGACFNTSYEVEFH